MLNKKRQNKKLLFEKGQLVWAQLTGYPWWPAFVDDMCEEKYKVMFFPRRNFATLPPDKLRDFRDNYEQFSKGSKKKEFLHGLNEIKEFWETDDENSKQKEELIEQHSINQESSIINDDDEEKEYIKIKKSVFEKSQVFLNKKRELNLTVMNSLFKDLIPDFEEFGKIKNSIKLKIEEINITLKEMKMFGVYSLEQGQQIQNFLDSFLSIIIDNEDIDIKDTIHNLRELIDDNCFVQIQKNIKKELQKLKDDFSYKTLSDSTDYSEKKYVRYLNDFKIVQKIQTKFSYLKRLPKIDKLTNFYSSMIQSNFLSRYVIPDVNEIRQLVRKEIYENIYSCVNF